MQAVHIGCSGWNYAEWRGLVYPEGLPQRRWLEYYTSRFDTVEVNATFYRLPKRETVEHWLEVAPEGFQFAIKASRYLTHIKRLREMPKYLPRLLEQLDPLLGTPKMGPMLWQLPESFQRDDDRLAAALPAFGPCRNAIELRHESWFCEPVYELLREHGVALVFGDHPERRFQSLEPTADWIYIRLHHGSRGRRGNYSPAELATWRRRIAAWRAEREVYLYANNDWEGFSAKNATWLKDHLSSN